MLLKQNLERGVSKGPGRSLVDALARSARRWPRARSTCEEHSVQHLPETGNQAVTLNAPASGG